MEFKEFRDLLNERISALISDKRHLFIMDVDKDEMWNLYLDSFPEGTNEIYREQREFDCNCCRYYIRDFGHVIVITKDNRIETIWGLSNIEDPKYEAVCTALDAYVKSRNIHGVFVTKNPNFGVEKNYGMHEGEVETWDISSPNSLNIL